MGYATEEGLTQEEKAAFDFFKRRSSAKLPGVFDSGFWESLVLQASGSEPAVLHALMALGAVHRSTKNHISQKATENMDSINADERLALQQYNKAISCLGIHFKSNDKDSFRVALITCMVFICIELLRGKFKVATTHLNNGLNLLHEIQNKAHPRGPKNSLILRPELGSVDDYLIEAFTRLNIHSSLFGQGSSFLYIIGQDSTCGPDYEIPQVFDTPRKARLYLDGLINGTYYLSVQIDNFFTAQGYVSETFVHRRNKLESSLRQWLYTFNECFSTLAANCNRRAVLGLPLLRLYHSMATIMVSTCTSPYDEMVYDSYVPGFVSILRQSMALWKLVLPELDQPPCLHEPELPMPSFTVDMGFIPPVYYTALKCRIPAIRRRAVNLLLAAPHREGVWDGVMVAYLARHVIEMEEGDFYKNFLINEDFDPLSDIDDVTPGEIPLIPQLARINSAEVILPDGVGSKATMICKYRTSERHQSWESKTTEFDLIFDDISTNCTLDCQLWDGRSVS